MFCSGAGGLDRALVIAQGHARLRRPARARDRRQELVPGRRDAGERVAPGALRRRAGPGHAAAADDPALLRPRRDPHRGMLGGDARRGGRGDTAGPGEQARRAGRPAERSAAGEHRHRAARRSTAGSSAPRPTTRSRSSSGTPSRPQARRSSKRRRGRSAHARSRRARRSIAPAATSSCSCCSTGSTRSRPDWAASGSKPHVASCRAVGELLGLGLVALGLARAVLEEAALGLGERQRRVRGGVGHLVQRRGREVVDRVAGLVVTGVERTRRRCRRRSPPARAS